MVSLTLYDFLPTVTSNGLLWFSLAASVNVISVKKISAVYSWALNEKVLYVAMLVAILFSCVEFLVYIVVLPHNSFAIKKLGDIIRICIVFKAMDTY